MLEHGPVALRPLRRRDRSAWLALRLRNEEWLAPWEATPPDGGPLAWEARHTPAAYGQLLRMQRGQRRAGTHEVYAVLVDGALAGQVSLGSIVRGAFNSCYVGYWVDRAVAGRGVAPTAVALVADRAFAIGLHRVEINIRPENAASIRVAEKVGATREGLKRSYLAIAGAYRDHVGFTLLAEDHPGGVLAALVTRGYAAR